MPRYFLSYARADSPFALRLADDLRAAGVDVWVDQRDIIPSQRWDRAVEAALRDCAGLLVVLSPRAVASDNVLDEVGFAIDHDKDVIPVLYESCDIPIRLRRLQRVDFTDDYRSALDRCITVLAAERRGAARRPLDVDLLKRAERELAAYIGPLAARIVETDASQARDGAELYRLLSLHILHPVKREAFLKNAPAGGNERPPISAAPPVFDRSMLEAATLELTKVLGPIAGHLVKQAAREAKDAADLFDRLAGRVQEGNERAALLKRLRALKPVQS